MLGKHCTTNAWSPKLEFKNGNNVKVNIYIDICDINKMSDSKVIDVKNLKNIAFIAINLFNGISITLQQYDKHKLIMKLT